jgi:hypothetical protein
MDRFQAGESRTTHLRQAWRFGSVFEDSANDALSQDVGADGSRPQDCQPVIKRFEPLEVQRLDLNIGVIS